MVSRLSIGGCCCGDCRYFGFAVFPDFVQQTAADLAAFHSADPIRSNPSYWVSRIETDLPAFFPIECPRNAVLYYRFDADEIATASFRKLQFYNAGQDYTYDDGDRLSGVLLGGLTAGIRSVSGTGTADLPGVFDWWCDYGFYLPEPGSADFARLQAYLSAGGTIFLNLPRIADHSRPGVARLVARANAFFENIGSGCRINDNLSSGLFRYRYAPGFIQEPQRTVFRYMSNPDPKRGVRGLLNFSVSETTITPEIEAAGYALLKPGTAPRGEYIENWQHHFASLSGPAGVSAPFYLSAPDSVVQQYRRFIQADFDFAQSWPIGYNRHLHNGRYFYRRSFALGDWDDARLIHLTSGPVAKMPVATHERLPGGGSLVVTCEINSTDANRFTYNWCLSQMAESCRIMRPAHSGTTWNEHTPQDGDGLRRAHTIGGITSGDDPFRPLSSAQRWNSAMNDDRIHRATICEFDAGYPLTSKGSPITPNVWGYGGPLWNWTATRAEITVPAKPTDGPDEHPGLRLTTCMNRIVDPVWLGALPSLAFQAIGTAGSSSGWFALASASSVLAGNYPLTDSVEMVGNDRAFWLSWYSSRIAPFVSLGVLPPATVAAIQSWIDDPEAPDVPASLKATFTDLAPINLTQIGRPESESPANYENEFFAIFGVPVLNVKGNYSQFQNLTVRPVIHQGGQFFYDARPAYREFNATAFGSANSTQDLNHYGCFGRLSSFVSESGSSLRYSMTDGLPFLPLAQFETGPLDWGTTYELRFAGLSFDFIRRTPPSLFSELYGSLPTL